MLHRELGGVVAHKRQRLDTSPSPLWQLVFTEVPLSFQWQSLVHQFLTWRDVVLRLARVERGALVRYKRDASIAAASRWRFAHDHGWQHVTTAQVASGIQLSLLPAATLESLELRLPLGAKLAAPLVLPRLTKLRVSMPRNKHGSGGAVELADFIATPALTHLEFASSFTFVQPGERQTCARFIEALARIAAPVTTLCYSASLDICLPVFPAPLAAHLTELSCALPAAPLVVLPALRVLCCEVSHTGLASVVPLDAPNLTQLTLRWRDEASVRTLRFEQLFSANTLEGVERLVLSPWRFYASQTPLDAPHPHPPFPKLRALHLNLTGEFLATSAWVTTACPLPETLEELYISEVPSGLHDVATSSPCVMLPNLRRFAANLFWFQVFRMPPTLQLCVILDKTHARPQTPDPGLLEWLQSCHEAVVVADAVNTLDLPEWVKPWVQGLVLSVTVAGALAQRRAARSTWPRLLLALCCSPWARQRFEPVLPSSVRFETTPSWGRTCTTFTDCAEMISRQKQPPLALGEEQC